MQFSRFFLPLLFVAGPLALVGCDSDDSNDSDLQTFEVTFTSLNSANNEGRPVTGTARFTVSEDDDTFTASIDASGLFPSVAHAQHIHASTACPTMADDANGDGFLDVTEGLPSYGAILVPLDGDLSAQATGADGFPVASATGSIDYDQSADLSDILADLRATDPDTTDAVIKLGAGGNLDLAGRHVVLHGIDPSVQLPNTVASIAGLPSVATLPVACGTIRATN